MRYISFSVAVVAALLAVVFIYKKHWLFLLPNGYILYAISGGTMPPYMQPRAFQKVDEWMLPGTVMISSCAKCGTNWNMNILHLIRTKGNEDFEDIYNVVPWVDFIYYPGQTLDDQIKYLNSRNGTTKYDYRIFKTHFAPPELPLRDDVKYIVVIRNATDVMASVRSFFNDHHPDFRAMWGGFPPSFESKEFFYKWWNVDQGDGTSGAEGLYFSFVKGWWPHRHKPNVFMAHYSDLKKDFRGEIKKYINFLGGSLTEDELNKVLHHASFDYMKKNSEKYEGLTIGELAKKYGYLDKNGRLLKPNIMVRKGLAGKGHEELDKQGLGEFMELYAKAMGDDPAMAHWCSYGGQIP